MQPTIANSIVLITDIHYHIIDNSAKLFNQNLTEAE